MLLLLSSLSLSLSSLLLLLLITARSVEGPDDAEETAEAAEGEDAGPGGAACDWVLMMIIITMIMIITVINSITTYSDNHCHTLYIIYNTRSSQQHCPRCVGRGFAPRTAKRRCPSVDRWLPRSCFRRTGARSSPDQRQRWGERCAYHPPEKRQALLKSPKPKRKEYSGASRCK